MIQGVPVLIRCCAANAHSFLSITVNWFEDYILGKEENISIIQLIIAIS